MVAAGSPRQTLKMISGVVNLFEKMPDDNENYSLSGGSTQLQKGRPLIYGILWHGD